MSETTGNLSIRYPSEYADPFWTDYVNQMTDLDENILAALEDSSLVMEGGGTLDLTGDTFSWSADLKLICTRTGAILTIPAGSTTITDGQVSSLSGLTRPLTTGSVSSFVASTSGPAYDSTKIPVFHRSGSNVYLVHAQAGLGLVTVEV